ncbi:MAG: glutamine--tRNA ligase/YqeY domain fusion protein [Gammaproteobacteria bacterium]|nr:glutamine--tRNA ligase/YqeY domain fusion protein [Gammaproteobacteria bacterium]
MSATPAPTNFIRRQIDADLAAGRHDRVVTRFPPEPNGYLHIGHAKSMWLNFGIADDYGGRCTLRFDDTNPAREDAEFAAAIEEDIRWLGYRWSGIAFASDYFEQLYACAVELIEKGLAYVDSQNADDIRAGRGTLTRPGVDSPYRGRPAAENLALFEGMKNGRYRDGEMVLRAKIDMASPNLNLRDPVLYRIRRHRHQRTGDQWCIYPLYDFAHGQSDAIEGVTHSLCTLEFEDHRPLYDWFLDRLTLAKARRPRQIEFSRLNLNYTVMSKRSLSQLVEGGDVSGWDDPRMPTLRGLRRRGFTPASIRRFISLVGITRKANVIEMGQLENCVREHLEPVAPRVMAVIEPLKLVIENYPPGRTETIDAPNHPAEPGMGARPVTLSRELYIERDDFMENPPNKFLRLAPGREVRLRYAFLIRCTGVVRDAKGRAVELRCQYDPDTRHGGGRKTGIIHWVNAGDAVAAEVRLYDRLLSRADPPAGKDADFRQFLNPRSLVVRRHALLEASLAEPEPGVRYQFERLGYFFPDADSGPGKLVFNRIVTLRDSWAKIDRQRAAGG